MSTRLAAASLGLAGLLFLLYPAVRPWPDESTVDGAVASLGSSAWVAAHLFAMVGFVLVALALPVLRRAVGAGPAGSLATTAAVITGIGAGLTLPYYGAEDFGLHAMATKYAQGQRFDLLGMIESVRYDPVAVTTFGAGLLLLNTGGVLVAVAVWRSGTLPRAAGIAFGAGFALYLPQFFTPAPVRIAHGVLVMIGAVWLAVALGRQRAVLGADRELTAVTE
jgi:hypothetical protein